MGGLAGQRGGRPSLSGLLAEAFNQGVQGTMEWLNNRPPGFDSPSTDLAPDPLRRDYDTGVPYAAPEEWPEEWGAPPDELPGQESDEDDRPGIILTPPGGQETITGTQSGAPSPADGVTGDPQPQPPLGGAPITPTTQVDARMEQELARKSREDDECQECERCDFLRDGEFAMKNYGGNRIMEWAMRYQHHVVHWQPYIPSARQIQEFDIADSSTRTGKRAMDGLAINSCFLVEAKLGYSKYLKQDWQIGAVVWRTDKPSESAMIRVTNQISSHHSIVYKYQRKYFSEHDHNVIWIVSNSLMELALRQHVLAAGTSTRVWIYKIAAPPSIFSQEPSIGENETDE